jgi:hypothetical protein
VARPRIDPVDLIGKRIVEVVVGWHVDGSSRSAVRLFLRLSDGVDVEVHASGDGSLALVPEAVPDDFDMDQHGRFKFRVAHAEHPASVLLQQPISRVERIRWNNVVVGLRLHVGSGVVVLANEADEVYVSDGSLPPDCSSATIG